MSEREGLVSASCKRKIFIKSFLDVFSSKFNYLPTRELFQDLAAGSAAKLLTL